MKLTILAALAASFTVGTLSAQTIDQASRRWDAGKLAWDEFLGESKSDTTINRFAYNVKLGRATEKIGNTTYIYSKFTPYFDQTESWTHPRFKNDAMLQYNQIMFDMLELYARRATIDFNRESGEYSDEQIRSFYKRQFDKQVHELDEASRRGTDADQLPFFATGVALDLERTHFNPAAVVEDQPIDYFGEFYAGVNGHFPISDYYNQSIGFNLGFGFGWKRHLWSMDMSLGFSGKAKADFDTRNGWIYEDEHLNVYQVYATYAYCAARNKKYQSFPFVGLGASGITHPLGDRDLKDPEKDGFSVCAGMMFDVFLIRRITIHPNWGSLADGTYQAIRIRPYFSLTQFNHLGWTPAINLSISYNWGGMSWSRKNYRSEEVKSTIHEY